MKKYIIFTLASLLLVTACREDDEQEGFNNLRAIFSPDKSFFVFTGLGYEWNSSILSKGIWTSYNGVPANGSIREFPYLEEGDILGKLQVLNSETKPGFQPEYRLIESIPLDAVNIDPKSGYVTLKDPSALMANKNQNLTIQAEIGFANRDLPLKLVFDIQELTSEEVIRVESSPNDQIILAYPHLTQNYPIGQSKVKSLFGDIHFVADTQRGLKIDPKTGEIYVNEPGFFDLSKGYSQSYLVGIEVTHPRTTQIWKKQISFKLWLSNAESMDCFNNNALLFNSNITGDNFQLVNPKNEVNMIANYTQGRSDEFTFVLSQPKLLCEVVSWSPVNYGDLTFELLNEKGISLLRQTGQKTYLGESEDDGWGIFPVYSPLLTSKFPYYLEANKLYSIRRIDLEDDEVVDWGFYTPYPLYYSTTLPGLDFPVQYGDITILSASYQNENKQKIDHTGIPLIDLRFSD